MFCTHPKLGHRAERMKINSRRPTEERSKRDQNLQLFGQCQNDGLTDNRSLFKR